MHEVNRAPPQNLPADLRERSQSTDLHLQEVMLPRFLGQCAAEERLQRLAPAERIAQWHFMVAEQAGPQPTICREPHPVA